MSPSPLAESITQESVADSGDSTAARGRPRSDARTEAILDAAVETMYDVGWDGFKVQEVARRAGAGLATIYRRWPTKEDLVADAIRHDMAQTEADAQAAGPTGDPRDAFLEQVAILTDKMCSKGGSIISVLAAARDHEAMSAALDEVINSVTRPQLRSLVVAVLGDGHPQVDVAADAVLGVLFLRVGILEANTSGQEFAAELLALLDAIAA